MDKYEECWVHVFCVRTQLNGGWEIDVIWRTHARTTPHNTTPSSTSTRRTVLDSSTGDRIDLRTCSKASQWDGTNVLLA